MSLLLHCMANLSLYLLILKPLQDMFAHIISKASG